MTMPPRGRDAGRGRRPAAGPRDPEWRDAIRGQLGAAIDMLESAVRACPGPLWSDRAREPQFWNHLILRQETRSTPGWVPRAKPGPGMPGG